MAVNWEDMRTAKGDGEYCEFFPLTEFAIKRSRGGAPRLRGHLASIHYKSGNVEERGLPNCAALPRTCNKSKGTRHETGNYVQTEKLNASSVASAQHRHHRKVCHLCREGG